jgi:hypothetical protein
MEPEISTPVATEVPAAVAPAALVAPAPVAAPEPQPEVEQQQPEPEPQAPSGEPYELVANVPDKYVDESRTEYLSSFSSLAPVVGIDAGMAQVMVDAFVEAAVTMPAYTFDAEHHDYVDCEREIVAQVGEEGAKNVITRAQRYAASVGPGFQAWLDETNLGNEPSVIRVLALAETGLFKVSQGKAQEMLDKITSDPKGAYYSSDSKLRLPEVVRVQVLSRIANRDAVDPFRQAAQEQQTRSSAPAASPDAVASARAELTKLAGQKSMSEADRARWIELTALITR